MDFCCRPHDAPARPHGISDSSRRRRADLLRGRSCHIRENWNQGILGNGNRVLIDRNIIAGNGTNKDTAQNLIHGIYATGSAFTITNNLIHSNTAYGIQVAAYDYKKDSMAGPEYAEARNWLISKSGGITALEEMAGTPREG